MERPTKTSLETVDLLGGDGQRFSLGGQLLLQLVPSGRQAGRQFTGPALDGRQFGRFLS
jgi:hypothetical protein